MEGVFKMARAKNFMLMATVIVLILVLNGSASAFITGPSSVNEDEYARFTTTTVPDTVQIVPGSLKYTWSFSGIDGGKKETTRPTCKYKWSVPTGPNENSISLTLKYTKFKIVETSAGPIPVPILPPVEICDMPLKKIKVKDITAPGQDDTTSIEGMPTGFNIKCGQVANENITLKIKDNNPYTIPGDWKVELFYQAGAWDFYATGQDSSGDPLLTYYLGPSPCNYAYSDIMGDNSLYYATEPVSPDDPFYSSNDPEPDPQAPINIYDSNSNDFPINSEHPLPTGGGCAWIGPIPFQFDSVVAGDDISKTLQFTLDGARIIAPIRHGQGASYYHDLKMFVKITDSSGNCVTAGYKDAQNVNIGSCTSSITVIDDCPPWLAVEIVNHSVADLDYVNEEGVSIDLTHDLFSLCAKTRERFCNFDDHWDASDNYLDNPDDENSKNSFLIEYDRNMIAEDTRLIFHPIASDNLDPAPLNKLMSLKSTGYASGTDPEKAVFRITNSDSGAIVKESLGKTDVPIPVIFREPGSFDVYWEASDMNGNKRRMTLKMVILDTRMNIDTMQETNKRGKPKFEDE